MTTQHADPAAPQLDLFAQVRRFDGVTYDPALDHDRLDRQLGRVFHCLSDHRWWTLSELEAECSLLRADGGRDSQAAISARLRDLRKARFGGYEVTRERVRSGLWRYRMERRGLA